MYVSNINCTVFNLSSNLSICFHHPFILFITLKRDNGVDNNSVIVFFRLLLLKAILLVNFLGTIVIIKMYDDTCKLKDPRLNA